MKKHAHNYVEQIVSLFIAWTASAAHYTLDEIE
jgi:hypothetical protein